MRYFAILPAIMGIIYFSHSSDFWLQLRTFTWSPIGVTVVSHTLQPSRMGFWDGGTHGEVRFTIDGDSDRHEYVDRVFERFSFDKSTDRTLKYIDALRPGTTHIAYADASRSTLSLGHFPRSYGGGFALSGFSSLLMAWLIWRERSKATENRTKEQASA